MQVALVQRSPTLVGTPEIWVHLTHLAGIHISLRNWEFGTSLFPR